jgi:hypothetical protein
VQVEVGVEGLVCTELLARHHEDTL